MWYLPESVASRPACEADRVTVAVFDITPLPDGVTAFGAVRNYYSVALMKKFVGDILEVSDEIAARTGRPIDVVLKHKRSPRPGRHDSSYLHWLDDLLARLDNFHLVPPDANLFTLMDECALSVSVPYTSTAYAGDAAGRPALYYDPFGELVPQFESTPLVQFASGRDELRRLMFQHLAPASAEVALQAR
jgi:polysaccharide biosynthesis PFTS motif protein